MILGNQKDSKSDHVVLKLYIPEEIICLNLPNRCYNIIKPKINQIIVDEKFSLNLKIEWNKKYKNEKINLNLINKFTNYIKNETGQRYGWKGGEYGYIKSNKSNKLRKILSHISNFVDLLNTKNEIKNVPDRINELLDYYINKLKNGKIIPQHINLFNIFDWIQNELWKIQNDIRLQIYYEDDINQQWKTKEKSLFHNIKDRSKWLQLVGFGKINCSLPNYLKNDNEKIIKPDIIKKIYHDKFAPNFNLQIQLSNDVYFPNVIIPSLKDIRFFHNIEPYPQGKKPWWWSYYYNRNAKNIKESIWNPLIEPITINELENTIKDININLASDLDGNHGNLIKSIYYQVVL